MGEEGRGHMRGGGWEYGGYRGGVRREEIEGGRGGVRRRERVKGEGQGEGREGGQERGRWAKKGRVKGGRKE